ncbi:hypothetical protein OKW76_15890 [Sphingomonas sp. S1-29]|uniref:PepSY domain-containing protein n=1 Tax=Sphingomonas qomolangmaensis TaxID=2918765 RepID=A0ABY5L7N9_9SPHN|nr:MULTISPECIES: hypothetical protein [Sphingomonas]UUL82978.1 hypothetical protein NMP03_01705 [Sphingomonas qomolangmaensis]UZK69464.1 hypothetical protein OKW76_15890 [Sphingomonas sp. S1-29]
MTMSAMRGFLGIACLLVPFGAVAGEPSQRQRDHDAVREARMQGRLLPLREIERRVVPQLRGARYLGFEFDSGSSVYTLKFLRDGNVIWVSVDGRSGQVLGRSGN